MIHQRVRKEATECELVGHLVNISGWVTSRRFSSVRQQLQWLYFTTTVIDPFIWLRCIEVGRRLKHKGLLNPGLNVLKLHLDNRALLNISTINCVKFQTNNFNFIDIDNSGAQVVFLLCIVTQFLNRLINNFLFLVVDILQMGQKLGCCVTCQEKDIHIIKCQQTVNRKHYTKGSQTHVVTSFIQSYVSLSGEPCPILAC